MDELREVISWYRSLDSTLKFLFALPFIVAAVGLLGDRHRQRREERRSAPPRKDDAPARQPGV